MSLRLRLAIALPALVLLAIWVGVRRFVELRPQPPLGAAARAAVMRTLRGALAGGDPAAPAGPGLERQPAGPVWATVYRNGVPVIRRACRAPSLGAAVAACGRGLADEAQRRRWSAADRAASRIKVDITVAEGPVVAWLRPAFALGVVPGVDGVGLRLGDREERLLPDDLLREDLLAGYRPFDFVQDFQAGLHVQRVVNVLARRLEVDAATWRREPKRFFRFRTEAFIEPAAGRDGAPLGVVRGATAYDPPLDRGHLRAAALAGGRYLLRAQRPDGRFDYVYETLSDSPSVAGYSLPRHFGTSYFLAQLYGATGDAAIGEGARRALELTPATVAPECRDGAFACVGQPGETTVDIGSSALALVALLEYRRVSGDHTHDELARRLAAFLLSMQRPAGDFAHLYRLGEHRPDPHTKLLYFDGEATLGLVRAHAAFGDPRYLEAARRGLDYLTKTAYRHFAGQFYFGEDHWTCLAAEAAWPHLRDPSYERFCRDYGAFLRFSQFRPGEHPADFAGAYGFTPFFPPHNTPAGSRTEAMISAYLLGRHHGRPDERLRRQCRETLRYLLRQQLRPDNCYLCRNPARAAGGFLMSPVSRHVRIDFVQHVGSALLRGTDLVGG